MEQLQPVLNFSPISSGAGYSGAISALGGDLIHNNSAIVRKTIGTSPNRTFIVEWKNARRYIGGAIVGDNYNFQIRLSETSNIIQIVYGTCTATAIASTNLSVQVGLRGATNADFNNRLQTSNSIWDSNTITGTANNSTCRANSSSYPNIGRTFTWTPPLPPTITSLSALTDCPGNSLTINGTDLVSTTSVTIGGTPVASITSKTATTVTVITGTGTTGNVVVTTPYGTATSASTFTFKATPPTPPNPTWNMDSCNPIITRVGNPSLSPKITWYWQTSPTGTDSTKNSISAYIPTTSGTYYLRPVNTLGCWGIPSSITVTVDKISSIATAPIPLNSSIENCYTGVGAINQLSWTAPQGQ